MDYTEQFIRLNCSLMSDYKMMKLNAEMKCMGIGLYIHLSSTYKCNFLGADNKQ